MRQTQLRSKHAFPGFKFRRLPGPKAGGAFVAKVTMPRAERLDRPTTPRRFDAYCGGSHVAIGQHDGFWSVSVILISSRKRQTYLCKAGSDWHFERMTDAYGAALRILRTGR